jgi:hypothetical protein
MHLSTAEFADKFNTSARGTVILEQVNAPFNTETGAFVEHMAAQRYANSWNKSLKLLIHRELLLWWRDKYVIVTKIIQSKFLCRLTYVPLECLSNKFMCSLR